MQSRSRSARPPDADSHRHANQSRRLHRDTPEGSEADAILRKCVHCGFCTATCPTYQLLGDELDGPRGRIYLMKQVLEGKPADREDAAASRPLPDLPHVRDHLPVGRGVRPAGRHRPQGRRAAGRAQRRQKRLARSALRTVDSARVGCFSRCSSWANSRGRCCRPLEAQDSAARAPRPHGPSRPHARKMLVLEGCVQPSLAPNMNAAAARVLDKLGISLVRAARGRLLRRGFVPPERAGRRRSITCGATSTHGGRMSKRARKRSSMTASGCGAMVKEYGHLLARDPAYAEKAARVSALMKDISEIIACRKRKTAKPCASRLSPRASRRSSPFTRPARCSTA